jgi:hypothetical protein
LDVPLGGRAHGKLNPECSVSSFRSFALQSHVHVDDINAEEAVRLMLAFYSHVTAPEGLLEEGGDVLHCEWGLYHCGEVELFHFEIAREFTEAGKEEDGNGVSRLTVGLHYRPTFTLRAITEGSHCCSSRLELNSFTQAVWTSEAYQAVATLPPAEIALEWGPV